MNAPLRKILYLEDVDDIAMIGKIALEDIGGFEVLHCTLGEDAVAAFPGFAPDLCLFDVMLPDISGVEAMTRIRTLPGGAAAPFVFMTAKAQLHEQAVYKDKGAVDVIVKPFDPVGLPDQLRAIWETVCGR